MSICLNKTESSFTRIKSKNYEYFIKNSEECEKQLNSHINLK